MEIVDIFQNDELETLARKCNTNFRRLAWATRETVRKQSAIDSKAVNEALQDVNEAMQEIGGEINRLENVVIPDTVSTQIDALDIPGMIDDGVASVIPPVGAYMMSDTSPDAMYQGTTWSQVDTVDTTGGLQIPVWQRTA